MGLILTLILGAFIGWLGASIMGRSEGIFASIAIGVLGAILGGWLAHMLGGGTGGYLVFSWASMIWALVGAIILSAILNGIQGHSSHV